VETEFACDASGFSTSRFARWFDEKWGKEKKHRIWLKAHICSGVKTNIITSVEITEGHANDSPQLSSLVRQTARNFEVKEVSCDRAYSSRKNLKLIADEGAIPFIPFKSNVSGRQKGSSVWGKMYHYFMYKQEEFLQHYHKRSNVETCFHMIKTKFRDNLRSKTQTAQINELLCKILAHNICVVIQEVNELGLRGEFVVEDVSR
jgi:transposase